MKANKENEQNKAVVSHIVANKEIRFSLLIRDFLLKFVSDKKKKNESIEPSIFIGCFSCTQMYLIKQI